MHAISMYGMPTNAIAMGTMGHRQLTSIDIVLELLPLMTRNLMGLKPLLPLSPSGWMPLVTSWPLWLYCGRDERRLSRDLFSLTTSRSRDDLWPLVYDDRPLVVGYSREDERRAIAVVGVECLGSDRRGQQE